MSFARHAAELAPLWHLARACGIKPGYTNVSGERMRANPDALLHVIQSYGIELASIHDANDARRTLEQDIWKRMIEPVCICWSGQRGFIQLRLPVKHASATVHGRVELEDDALRNWTTSLGDVEPSCEMQVGGRRYVKKDIPVPESLPFGYHRVSLMIDGQEVHSHLFVAPQRAWQPHVDDATPVGAFLPLYALQSQHSWGVGDLTDLHSLAECVQHQGGSALGTLPLLAAFLDEPCEISPYSPISRLFFNELYLDVTAAPEFERCDIARTIATSAQHLAERTQLREMTHVDHRRAMALKRSVLEPLADLFFSRPSSRRESLRQLLQHKPHLASYAAFRAITARRRTTWQNWPKRLREGRLVESDYDRREYRYHLYVQLLLREQLGRAAAAMRNSTYGLYLDLPVGVNPGGFDAWQFQDEFVSEVSVGAPPDEFFTEGQDWGFQPLHPQRTRASGHAYFRACVQANLEFAGSLRIDHIMGLHRLYWVPRGISPRDGVYVRYPAEELYAVLCIESHRARAGVVGENLGTVPASVNTAMRRHNVSPLYVAQFSWTGNAKQPINPPSPGAIASLNTHDVPMFASFWIGEDIDQRVELGLLTIEEARAQRTQRARFRASILAHLDHSAVREGDMRGALMWLLTQLARSEARLVLINLEDLWLERRPQNVPGTQLAVNWSRKATYSLERMCTCPHVISVLARIVSLDQPIGRKT